MSSSILTYNVAEIIFEPFNISNLTPTFILENCATKPDIGAANFYAIQPIQIELNVGSFTNPGSGIHFPTVLVECRKEKMIVSCTCNQQNNQFCHHQAQVLYNIMERKELLLFFDPSFRYQSIQQEAIQYGLEKELFPDEHFELIWNQNKVSILPRLKQLQAVNEESLLLLAKELLPTVINPLSKENKTNTETVVVFSEHKFYKHLQIGLYEAGITALGKIKNTLNVLDAQELAWQSIAIEEMKFYTGVAAFKNNHNKNPNNEDLKALQAIVQNPLGIKAYYHDTTVSENIGANSLLPIELKYLLNGLELNVYLKHDMYEISGQLMIADKKYLLNNLQIKYGYFLMIEKTLQLVNNADLLRVMAYFKKHNNIVFIYQSKFDDFRKSILAKLEDSIKINYAWLAVATKEQLEEQGFEGAPQQLIYLSEEGQHIMISPVIRYGEVEVSVLSKRQLYARDQKNNAFVVERDAVMENEFTSLMLLLHPDFWAQIHQQAFYLTQKQFLEDAWFLDAFEAWRAKQIKILGFNEINKDKLNTHKATISIKVTSGLDWFDTDLEVRYGKQKASLRQLHKSIKNGSKYVTLDDGTLGMLPAEWIKKMARYFEAGTIVDDRIHTARVNFSLIDSLYEKEMLGDEVVAQLNLFKVKLADFKSIDTVYTPLALKTRLRHYQQEGLNWLNFLDDFGLGGCLADDMGLGKTLQIIAFILLLQQKHGSQTHLIVVPTSLIFNWQNELDKFAPSLKVLIIHGSKRVRSNQSFNEYDIILTSYGMVISTIHFIKTFHFGYIFLDESQAIKNYESQRYKACRLLQSRNKLVITGTPIENNTFDLYGQLSFACPGLLGNAQYFKDIYAQPIDKFGDSKRAKELQQKVNPFILRRTKKQVATELPEKTEMIIYCEMGVAQRKVYDAYEKEFRDYLLHQPEGDLPRDSMHVLQGLTKLRQICNSPALLKEDVFYGDASAKIEVLVDQIVSKHQHHKILVFSQFVGMLDLIRKELAAKYIAYEYLTGQTKNREAAVNTFQTNDDIRVFLISLKAGGVGLNLTEADYVYLVDPWWNPAAEDQAIDRCYRIGQQKHVVAVRLICPDTIEEKILKLQASKKELVNDLIKTDASILKNLQKADLIELLS